MVFEGEFVEIHRLFLNLLIVLLHSVQFMDSAG